MTTCPHCHRAIKVWLNGDVITYTGGCKHVAGFRWPSLEPVWREPKPHKEHSAYEMYD